MITYINVLALILCNFEKNLCDWKLDSVDHLYKWQRRTANSLINNDLPGPDADYHDVKDTYFLYAGDKLAGTNSTGTGLTATLRSPDFIVEEHPLECFSFWFYFGVSIFYLGLFFQSCVKLPNVRYTAILILLPAYRLLVKVKH